MKPERRLSVALGVAFLFQATLSLMSGMIPLSLIVPGNIDQSMIDIAGHPALMRVNFLGDLITAVRVIVLAILLYVVGAWIVIKGLQIPLGPSGSPQIAAIGGP